MKECAREQEVVETVTSGRWSDSAGVELRNHALTCPVCKDVVLVAQALQEEHAATLADTRLPSAGIVWWRATLRARQEATRAAERPITIAHGVAAAATVGALVALIVGMLPSVSELFIGSADLPRTGVMIAAFAALLVIAPVALYFVFSDK